MRRLLALLATFIVPGTGHFVMGRPRRGLLWLLGYCVLALACHLLIWFLLLTVVLRIFELIDLFLITSKRWGNPQTKGSVPIVVAGFVASFGLLWLVSLALGTFAMNSSSGAPTLTHGDRVVVSKLAYALSAPKRGDVVVFRVPEEKQTFVYRIVGLAGDSVEIRCAMLYINDRPQPQELQNPNYQYFDRIEDHEDSEPTSLSRYRERLGETWHDILQPHIAPADLAVPANADAIARSTAKQDFPVAMKDLESFMSDEMVGASPDFPDWAIPISKKHEPMGKLVQVAGSGSTPRACEPVMKFVVPDGHVFVLGDNRPNSFDSRFRGPIPVSSIVGRVLGIYWSTSEDSQGIGSVR